MSKRWKSPGMVLLCLTLLVSLGCGMLPGGDSPAEQSGTNPQIHSDVVHERNEYNLVGVCSSRRVGVDVSNDGEAGYVLVTARQEEIGSNSQAFFMDEGETVTVWLRVSCFTISSVVEWTAEPSAGADQSDERMSVERHN